MDDKSLVMTFLNAEGSKTSITLTGVKVGITETEIAAAMDVVIAANIFNSAGKKGLKLPIHTLDVLVVLFFSLVLSGRGKWLV